MEAFRIIVIGASSGGVEALKVLFQGLDSDLNAAIFIVLHIPPDVKSFLPEILSRKSQVPVEHARDGARIKAGHAYIAPPGKHLILQGQTMHLQFGPKVNHTRPAIDPLFESAAIYFGSRVIGVILTGNLYDGTKGLLSIKRAGGVAVVQDPDEAPYSGMPSSALQNVPVDYRLAVSEIAVRLNQLTISAVLEKGEIQVNQAIPDPEEDEVNLIKEDFLTFEKGYKGNQRSVLSCPDCGGVLWELQDGKLVRYRCHTGHIFNPEVLLSSHDEALEKTFWTAIRLLIEKAAVGNRLAQDAKNDGNKELEAYYLKIAREAEDEAQRIRSTWFDRKAGESRNSSAGEQANEEFSQSVD